MRPNQGSSLLQDKQEASLRQPKKECQEDIKTDSDTTSKHSCTPTLTGLDSGAPDWFLPSFDSMATSAVDEALSDEALSF